MRHRKEEKRICMNNTHKACLLGRTRLSGQTSYWQDLATDRQPSLHNPVSTTLDPTFPSAFHQSHLYVTIYIFTSIWCPCVCRCPSPQKLQLFVNYHSAVRLLEIYSNPQTPQTSSELFYCRQAELKEIINSRDWYNLLWGPQCRSQPEMKQIFCCMKAKQTKPPKQLSKIVWHSRFCL